MSEALLTGLFGALGTVLGGAVTAGNAVISAKSDRRRASADATRAEVERRRNVYRSFLSYTRTARESLRQVVAASTTGGQALDRAQASHDKDWQSLYVAVADVQLESQRVGDAAIFVVDALGSESDRAYSAARRERRPAKSSTDDQLHEAVDEAVRAFLAVARSELDSAIG